MITPISIKEKQDFIRWFLHHYQLKNLESLWIFKYLLTHITYLTHVHFVTNVQCTPRGMIVSTVCSESIAFRYHKMHVVTDDPEKTFHDIRMNKLDPLYIQLNFKNAYKHPLYTSVLEENPFKCHTTHSFLERRVQLLQQQINMALDCHDKNRFYKLTEELIRLRQMFN